MLSSKHLLEQSGISRATLNNYIALGLLPPPLVKHPGPDAKAPRLGYFDQSALEVIQQVGELKRQGYSMARITEMLGRPASVPPDISPVPPSAPSSSAFRPPPADHEAAGGELAAMRRFIADHAALVQQHPRYCPPPCLTPMAILVAELQASSRIGAELPPPEQFELTTEMWTVLEEALARFSGISSPHGEQGVVGFFLPQSKSNYLFNAIECAFAMRGAMAALSQKWRRKKQWFNELQLNIALHGGEEWFGAYRSSTNLELRVLSEGLNAAAQLSTFARDGAIWGTKQLIAKLSAPERDRLRYGIRRAMEPGRQVVIPDTYVQIAELPDLDSPNSKRPAKIALLPVTELMELLPAAPELPCRNFPD